MSQPSPIELTHKYFGYLFNEYGFDIAEVQVSESFGNWVVILLSEKYCRVRLIQDRGEILISFGPVWSPPGWEAGPWYDISIVLTALRKETMNLPKYTSSSEVQIATLTEIIRPLMPSICDLFMAGNYEKGKKTLDQIKRRVDNEAWDNLIRKE